MARVAGGLVRAPRAPPAAVFIAALLLATSLLAIADASRPLKQLSSSSSEGAAGAAAINVESPPLSLGRYIDTVVGGGAGHHHRWTNIDMLRGIKDSGPSPGVGH